MGNQAITATYTMTGKMATFNGITFYKCVGTSAFGPGDGYYGRSGSTYFKRAADEETNEPYLDDSKSVGQVYFTGKTDIGNTGVSMQYTGTIVEKNITKTVNSKKFSNVIHTRVEIQVNDGSGSGSQVSSVNEYYVAKGVGEIEVDEYSIDPISGKLFLATKQTISSYNIK